MSIFIKNNPYDKFIINSSKLIKRTLSTKKDLSLNSSLKCTNQRLLLSAILKGTKSILNNKLKFSGYMNEYQTIVAKLTFKRPDIQNYPLLRKEFSSMIPVKNQKIEKKRNKTTIKNVINNPLNFEEFKEKYMKNLSLSMNSIENKNNKYHLNGKTREKEKLLLFSDFFYKWNNEYKSRNQYKNYSTLSYEENEIFYNDYSEFIKEKMNYLQKNKLENLQKKLKINLLDSQKKKIKLQLISMKLIFEPINIENINIMENEYNFEDYQEIYNYRNVETEEEENDEDINNNNNNIITFPLSYVFLFYANEIDNFKDILLSSIKFSNDYKKIIFEENEIYTTIRREKEKEKNKIKMKKLYNKINQQKVSIKYNPKAFGLKKSTSKVLSKLTISNYNDELKNTLEIQDLNNNISNEEIIVYIN